MLHIFESRHACRTHRLYGTLFCLFLLLASNACTFIAYSTGKSIDTSFKGKEPGKNWNLAMFEPGQKVWIVLDDGTQLSGKYLGVENSETTEASQAPGRVLILRTRGSKKRIALNEISSIYLSKNVVVGRLLLTPIGIAVDTLAVVYGAFIIACAKDGGCS